MPKRTHPVFRKTHRVCLRSQRVPSSQTAFSNKYSTRSLFCRRVQWKGLHRRKLAEEPSHRTPELWEPSPAFLGRTQRGSYSPKRRVSAFYVPSGQPLLKTSFLGHFFLISGLGHFLFFSGRAKGTNLRGQTEPKRRFSLIFADSCRFSPFPRKESIREAQFFAEKLLIFAGNRRKPQDFRRKPQSP